MSPLEVREAHQLVPSGTKASPQQLGKSKAIHGVTTAKGFSSANWSRHPDIRRADTADGRDMLYKISAEHGFTQINRDHVHLRLLTKSSGK